MRRWAGLVLGRLPLLGNPGEERLLVPLDPPHILEVLREREADGVCEEEAERAGEPREHGVGDQGGEVACVRLGEGVQEVAANLVREIYEVVKIFKNNIDRHPRSKNGANTGDRLHGAQCSRPNVSWVDFRGVDPHL